MTDSVRQCATKQMDSFEALDLAAHDAERPLCRRKMLKHNNHSTESFAWSDETAVNTRPPSREDVRTGSDSKLKLAVELTPVKASLFKNFFIKRKVVASLKRDIAIACEETKKAAPLRSESVKSKFSSIVVHTARSDVKQRAPIEPDHRADSVIQGETETAKQQQETSKHEPTNFEASPLPPESLPSTTANSQSSSRSESWRQREKREGGMHQDDTGNMTYIPKYAYRAHNKNTPRSLPRPDHYKAPKNHRKKKPSRRPPQFAGTDPKAKEGGTGQLTRREKRVLLNAHCQEHCQANEDIAHVDQFLVGIQLRAEHSILERERSPADGADTLECEHNLHEANDLMAKKDPAEEDTFLKDSTTEKGAACVKLAEVQCLEANTHGSDEQLRGVCQQRPEPQPSVTLEPRPFEARLASDTVQRRRSNTRRLLAELPGIDAQCTYPRCTFSDSQCVIRTNRKRILAERQRDWTLYRLRFYAQELCALDPLTGPNHPPLVSFASARTLPSDAMGYFRSRTETGSSRLKAYMRHVVMYDIINEDEMTATEIEKQMELIREAKLKRRIPLAGDDDFQRKNANANRWSIQAQISEEDAMERCSEEVHLEIDSMNKQKNPLSVLTEAKEPVKLVGTFTTASFQTSRRHHKDQTHAPAKHLRVQRAAAYCSVAGSLAAYVKSSDNTEHAEANLREKKRAYMDGQLRRPTRRPDDVATFGPMARKRHHEKPNKVDQKLWKTSIKSKITDSKEDKTTEIVETKEKSRMDRKKRESG